MVDLFVGRQRELRESLGLLTGSGDGAVQDIVGVRGTGKTSFLQRLSELARREEIPRQEVRVYNLDMQQYGLGVGFSPGDLDANATLEIVREVFTISRQLMGSVAKGQREFKAFSVLSRELGKRASFPPSPSLRIADRGVTIDEAEIQIAPPDDTEVRQYIRALQSRLDDGFVNAWEEFTARRRILITVDNFQLAADNELGQWFIRLAKRLRNTLTVLARTPSDIPLWREGSGPSSLHLPYFSVDEITAYLQRRLGTSAPLEELAQTTHDFTNGHPEGVNLVGNLIMNKGGEELPAAGLRRMLDSLPNEGAHFWAALVDEILHSVRGDDLVSAVNAASVAATFDTGMLAELVHPENPQEAKVGEIVAKLFGLRMLHRVPEISGEPSDRWRLHEFIRQSVAFKLQTSTPGEWRRLHWITAQYYFRRLKEWDTEPYDSYGAWYRFEHLGWQECKREWLLHSGLALDRAFVTRARFTLVFLEAFWWWGVYLPFPFMRRLLDDWARASAEWMRTRSAPSARLERHKDPNEILLAALIELLHDYPVTHVKPSTSPWDAMCDSLITIRTLCGLTPAGELDPAARRRATAEEQAEIIRTGAFITLFLGQSRRFRDPADPSAERFYEAALTTFRELGDKFTSAWLVFERCDLALERRDLRTCVERVAESARVVQELASDINEWERELLANVHRAWADVCWLNDNLDRAARHYGWAVANAYWFHGELSAVDANPHGPDEYTQQFYREMTLRAAKRVDELADRPAQMRRFVSEMLPAVPCDSAQAALAADLAGATIGQLQEMLFPPGPAEDELRRIDTTFMGRWRRLYLNQQDPLIGLEEVIHAELDNPTRQGA